MRKSFIYFLLFLFLSSCEDVPDYFFKNKAEGRRAFGLQGIYEISERMNDTLEFKDTIKFSRLRKNDFLITSFSKGDTLYEGEIVKRKGLYFMNKKIKNDYWDIRAFCLTDDSIYNYSVLDCKADYNSEIEIKKIFSDYSLSEKDEHKTYIILNSRNETYNALYANTFSGEKVAYRKLDLDYSNDKIFLKPEQIPAKACNVLVYPNPAKDFLYLDFDLAENYEVKISDMSGKNFLHEKFFDSYRTLNISSFPNGNYVLEIYSQKEKKVSQLVMISK